jgi:5'-deoxynucleotidase YfbR-like HD superfamily hydrolase/nucleoside phosphorylase
MAAAATTTKTQSETRLFADDISPEDPVQPIERGFFMAEKVAVAILIAVEDEFERLGKRFDLQPEPETAEGPAFHCFSFVDTGGNKQKAIVRFFKSMGPSDARVSTLELLGRYDPALVVSCGVSGALADWIRLGDLVIATSSEEYEYRGKIVPGANGEGIQQIFGGRAYPTAEERTRKLAEFSESHAAEFDRWQQECRARFPPKLSLKDFVAKGMVNETPKVHLGAVACGNDVGAAPEFKKALKGHNRNYLALDMESAGVLQACSSKKVDAVVVRVISDLADDKKEHLEEATGYAVRYWASDNLFAFLNEVFRGLLAFSGAAPHKTSGQAQELLGALHELALKQFEAPYGAVDGKQLEIYQRFFRRIIAGLAKEEPAGSLVLADCAREILSTKHKFPLRVDGPPGAGKTSFLACLYWQIRLSAADGPDCLPVYIDLKRYQELADKGAGALRDDLNPLRRSGELPKAPIVFLIDGVEEYSGPSAEPEKVLWNIVKDLDARLIASVAVGFHYENAFRRDMVRYEHPAQTVSLGPLRVDHPAFAEFVDSFVGALPPEHAAKREFLLDVVRKFGLEWADLRTLSMIALHARRAGFAELRNLTEFYRRYCEESLGADIAPTSELAYRYSLERQQDARDELRNNPAAWKLLHSHTTIRDYLVAEHAIRLVTEAATESKVLDRISYVFPTQIARFAKEIVNEEQQLQADVLTAAEKATAAGHGKSLAWLGYLAGRIENPGLKPRAIAALTKIKTWAVDQSKTAAPEARPSFLLNARTAYISLMNLGRGEMVNEYIDWMYRDKAWDSMNRAFHLEYYNDIDYTPGLELAREDALQDFPNTYRVLMGRLLPAAKSKEKYPGCDIHIYTLLSLAQHRHVHGKLSHEYRRDILKLIDDLMANVAARPRFDVLRRYIAMVRRVLQQDKFKIGRIGEEMLNIKFRERRGWLLRQVNDRVESVADHSYGAWLLAYIYLPEAAPEIAGYDKREILDMLLAHDLAEAYTGDLLPSERGSSKLKEERETFGYIGALGTFEGVGNMDRLRALWENFEDRASENAKIAKDIDRLECLLQLYIYQKRTNNTVSDADTFEAELIDEIKHPITIKMLDTIREHFA